MRWIRNIFAALAIACLALWISSYFFVYDAYIPIKNNTGPTFSLYTNYMSFGIEQGGTLKNPGDEWEFDIGSRRAIHEGFDDLNQILRDSGVGDQLPHFEEFLEYGYDAKNLSHPNGQWTWYSYDFTFPTWLPILLFGL